MKNQSFVPVLTFRQFNFFHLVVLDFFNWGMYRLKLTESTILDLNKFFATNRGKLKILSSYIFIF